MEFQEELDSVLEDLNDAKTFRDHVFDMVDPLTTVRSSLRSMCDSLEGGGGLSSHTSQA